MLALLEYDGVMNNVHVKILVDPGAGVNLVSSFLTARPLRPDQQFLLSMKLSWANRGSILSIR